MAKAVKTRTRREAPELLVSLHAPGMTPLLRAGAGGLAASLRALLLREAPGSPWPAPVPVGPGSALVEPASVRLSWGGEPPEKTLEALFHASFRLHKSSGLIDLPGTYAPGGPPPDVALAAALQEALKLTFLQHGKTTTKAGAPKVHTFSIDERELHVEFQPYSDFVHQEAWKDVAQALAKGSTPLAGWAYPGAAERHIGLRVTKMEYTAAEALCACFALVGCLSYKLPRGGALVALAPTDLVRFAQVRPLLTPRRLAEVSMAGASDAVLAVQLALRTEALGARLRAETYEAITLRTLPWARQQKSRGGVLRTGSLSESVLERYHTIASQLPQRLKVLEPKDKKGQPRKQQGPADFFVASSPLRAFITDNLATGQPWYAGFATQGALGKLYPEERKGLFAMLKHLEDAERILVESVHLALKQRFGAIAEENRDNPAARKNRWNSERDRWRLAFAGAKTLDQVRAALADLWSRAGPNRALMEGWPKVLPLLRSEHWRAARDLALVALASYQRQGPEETEEEAEPSAAE